MKKFLAMLLAVSMVCLLYTSCPGGFILLLICFWQDSEMMEEKFPPGEPIDIASQPVV